MPRGHPARPDQNGSCLAGRAAGTALDRASSREEAVTCAQDEPTASPLTSYASSGPGSPSERQQEIQDARDTSSAIMRMETPPPECLRSPAPSGAAEAGGNALTRSPHPATATVRYSNTRMRLDHETDLLVRAISPVYATAP
ncbi:hypothetical protein CCUS01_15164 [Colletotrichum cuscutae]|uniref:Uncharacterized protein n=1 Tax=Colletotrichum cuscutae TaxID=1209917 RepID=A0AAI9VET2_9PEZI|nr:hypothetical protein CCUS01_15164 [Colletotrichum cuscutae]